MAGKRGRQKRKITDEMRKDIAVLSQDEYCEKHKCGELFFLKLYKEVAVIKKQPVDIFMGLVRNPEELISIGYAKYYKKTTESMSSMDKKLSDIYHEIEFKNHSQAEKIALLDMQKEVLEERRIIKTEWGFLESQKFKIQDLISFINTIHQIKTTNDAKRYEVKIMTKEFGKNIIKE